MKGTKTTIALALLVAVGLTLGSGVAMAGGDYSKDTKDKDKSYKDKPKKHGQKKVKICHKGRTKYVPKPALSGHLGHGDKKGECPSKGHGKW